MPPDDDFRRQMMVYYFWSCFPVLALLLYFRVVSYSRYELLMCILDIMSKNVFCMTFLSGNFCLMDTVAAVRTSQLEAEKSGDTKVSWALQEAFLNFASTAPRS